MSVAWRSRCRRRASGSRAVSASGASRTSCSCGSDRCDAKKSRLSASRRLRARSSVLASSTSAPRKRSSPTIRASTSRPLTSTALPRSSCAWIGSASTSSPKSWSRPGSPGRPSARHGPAATLTLRAGAPRTMSVHYENDGALAVVTIDRPEVANAIDAPTARELADAFRAFEADDAASVAVLTGSGGTFCAGADLKAMRSGEPERVTRLSPEGDGPVGPTRMLLSKPVIAAVEGHAVAGGLELALWCDLRVASEQAGVGVYCRRWGITPMDRGSVRLARLIGHSHALDLILTGRGVSGEEARSMGLINRLVPASAALPAAKELALEIASKPQAALRSDRLSSYEQWSLSLYDALVGEYRHGLATLQTQELIGGLERYESGAWRSERADEKRRGERAR